MAHAAIKKAVRSSTDSRLAFFVYIIQILLPHFFTTVPVKGIHAAKRGGGLMCHKKVMLSLFSLVPVSIESFLLSTELVTFAVPVVRKKQTTFEMLRSQRTIATVNSLAFIIITPKYIV
jgi:hypothetical protein